MSGKQGFASMDPETRGAIASKGGRRAHQKGTAHEWTSEEARAAGRKGGIATAWGRAARDEARREAESAYAAHTDVRP